MSREIFESVLPTEIGVQLLKMIVGLFSVFRNLINNTNTQLERGEAVRVFLDLRSLSGGSLGGLFRDRVLVPRIDSAVEKLLRPTNHPRIKLQIKANRDTR